MSMTLSGNGTITGLVSGGLPDGTVLPADLSTGGPYWDTSGNLLVGKTSATANGGDVQISKGITFPATQVACSDPNTLDDYEEGTWTPTLTLDGTSHSYTYFCRKYTKIGRQVTVSFGFGVTGVTSQSAGALSIDGLPFSVETIGSSASYENGVSAMLTERMSGYWNTTTPHQWYVGAMAGTSSLNVFEQNYNGTLVNATFFSTAQKSSVQTGAVSVYFVGQISYTTAQ